MSKIKQSLLFAFFAVAIFGLSGCQSSVSVVPTRGANGEKLDRAGRVYILNPDYAGQAALATGSQQVIDLLKSSLNFKTFDVKVAPVTDTLDQLLVRAREENSKYIIAPYVSTWETRDGKPNSLVKKAVYQLKVYRVADGAEIYGVAVSGESGFQSDTTSEVLETPIAGFVNSLY